jgi:hypothetical protein
MFVNVLDWKVIKNVRTRKESLSVYFALKEILSDILEREKQLAGTFVMLSVGREARSTCGACA